MEGMLNEAKSLHFHGKNLLGLGQMQLCASRQDGGNAKVCQFLAFSRKRLLCFGNAKGRQFPAFSSKQLLSL